MKTPHDARYPNRNLGQPLTRAVERLIESGRFPNRSAIADHYGINRRLLQHYMSGRALPPPDSAAREALRELVSDADDLMLMDELDSWRIQRDLAPTELLRLARKLRSVAA